MRFAVLLLSAFVCVLSISQPGFARRKQTLPCRAVQKIRTWKNSDLTIEKMNELHLILTEDTLDEPECAGRMRESPKDDGVVVHDDTQNVLHYPPKGRELPKRWRDFFVKCRIGSLVRL